MVDSDRAQNKRVRCREGAVFMQDKTKVQPHVIFNNYRC